MEENTNVVADTGAEETVSFTKEELSALIQSETDKRVTQAMQTAEKKKAKEIEQAKKLAGLSAQEQYELKLKEKEELLLQRENSLTLLENKSATVDILNTKGLPIEFADIINDLDAEVINGRINIIEKVWKPALKKAVEDALPISTPSGTKASASGGISKEAFKKMSLPEQQQLYQTQPDLYKQLIT